MKKLSVVLAALLVILLGSCVNGQANTQTIGTDLGLVPIGGVPKDLKIFTSSDCEKYKPKFHDCSAEDADGRMYTFFDGGLARVSLTMKAARKGLQLPAGIQFGENIKSAATKAMAVFGVKMTHGKSKEGAIVYTSDFVVRSNSGWTYSLELIADDEARLVEVIERANLP